MIYEVTTAVRGDLIERYETYLTGTHIPERLATGLFSGARFLRAGDRFRIQYETDHLGGYLAKDAERLRADFLEHFPKESRSSAKTGQWSKSGLVSFG